MEYKLAQQEDGSYFIEGGIVLNYAEADYPAMRELDYNLYFHVTMALMHILATRSIFLKGDLCF